MTDTVHPRIYVACLASYNSGTLHGAWIAADQDAEDIRLEINAMLAQSPEQGAEEYAIHDMDEFCGIDIGEYESIDKVAEIAALLVEHGPAYAAYYDHEGDMPSGDAFLDAYCGRYDTEQDYAEEMVDDTGMLDEMPEQLRYYFDYAAWTRDLFISDFYSVRASEYDSAAYGVYVFRRD